MIFRHESGERTTGTVVGGTSTRHVACEHCSSDDIFPTESSSESYISIVEEVPSLSIQSGGPSDPDATYNIEYNHDTKVALEFNPVHTLSQKLTRSILLASLSKDGKYLATVSETGIVQIFDVGSAKRL